MTKRITDRQRQARVVARHHLNRSAGSVVRAVAGVAAFHSSDPISPVLAARARVAGFASADLDTALYADRTLWRLHAMRRTLFVVPADWAPDFDAGVGRAVAVRERARLHRWLDAGGGVGDAETWLARLEDSVLEALAGGATLRTADLAAAIPELAVSITVGSGRSAGQVPLSSRLLYLMAMDGRIVRTHPAGTWRSSQYHWAATESWFGRAFEPIDPSAGRIRLLRRYLTAFGPATMTDIRWWTGWSVGHARAAVAGADTAAVRLDDGGEGLVAADDLDDVDPGGPAATLLPGLDSTTMGWKERSWYLGDHSTALFDRNGNAGPTVWADGRVVGGWAQQSGGKVVFRLLEDVGRERTTLVEAEAAALTEWLGGVAVTPRFRTPLERELAGDNASD